MNLNNPKHEQFARALARGASVDDAYVQAGFTGGNTAQAKALAKTPDIVKRVNELAQEVEDKLGYELEIIEGMDPDQVRKLITENYLIKELVVSIKMSQQAGQFNATKALIELLGKEMGMFGGNGAKAEDTTPITNQVTNNIINVLQNMNAIEDMSREMIDITPKHRLSTVHQDQDK